MAERRGIFQRSDLSRVQAHGLAILYDRDEVKGIEERQEALTSALKYALVANDPTRIPTLFPTMVKQDNKEAVEAMDSGAPVTVETDTAVDVDDVEAFFRAMESGEFTVTELDGVFDIDSEGDY